MSGVFRRFYLLRSLSAVLLCLPGILLCLWYSWEAYASFDRYNRMTDAEATFNIEEFHLQLFDVVRRDMRRMFMPPPPSQSRLKKFAFHISHENLTKLYAGAQMDSGRPYIQAKLEQGGKLIPLELRLRGQRHWHNLGRQKSLKIRLPKGKLVNGYRIFNLINDPMPIVVGEQIILDIAKKKDVLIPKSSFARVLINGSDIGVFRYETQPDEGLLRANRMVPGSIYSGNLPGSAKTHELWDDQARWRKSAWRIDDEEHEFPELERFLENVRSMSIREFARFARDEMDMEAFATFDALDVAFGSDQHDFRQNHKLHHDPYRGRWEPVAWNFRGFQNDPFFNLTENPILLRLKMVPEYISMRNRILHKLLVKECSVSSVRSRGKKLLKRLAPELASDRYFDAYKMLPRVDRFHRQMVRPMNLRRAALVFESEMTTYRKRHTFLMRELKKNPLWIRLNASRTAESPESEIQEKTMTDTPFDIIVDGRAGVKLGGFRVTWPAECADVRWHVQKDGVPITEPSTQDRTDPVLPNDLLPGVRLVGRDKANSKRGDLRTEMSPTAFRYVLKSTCAPVRIEAEGAHLATGSTIRSRPVPSAVLARLPKETLGADDVPQFVVGEISPAPEDLRKPEPETIRLGPGTVDVSTTRVFEKHQRVEVAPGTHFVMGENASLVFLGPVVFQGTGEAPIVIAGAGGESWGGVALQGPGTAGSSLAHVHATGGTTPRYRMIPYPGMINIHGTKNITIKHCRFGDNTLSDDVVHTAYLKNLSVENTEIADAFSDAFDLEFTSSSLRRITTKRAGDDGLDLMGGKTSVADSVFLDNSGYGISAGEESEVEILDTLIAGSKSGLLAKNASEVSINGSLLYRNKSGVRVYKKTVRYVGESRITSDVLFVVGSEKVVKRDKKSKDALELGRIQRRLPTDGTLDHLAENVLGLDGWNDLESFIKAETEGGEQ
ncbi:MAG: hypothetical protein GY854_28510 [Deltaproteobacteria bacterium]|nr:hypothetical protein [Deltaproteobacteria bacterium]